MELITHYKKICQQNGFVENTDQLHVMRILEAYGADIYAFFSKKQQKSFITSLFSKFSKNDLPQIPYGVYLYGGVGRGKSMLMDLFFDHLPIDKKKRVHFHQFMQDVHQRLRQARSNKDITDALIYVADQIADEACFICFDEFQVLDITDAMILGRLFTALINRNVYFVMTSNRHPNDLYLNGLNRQLFLPFIELLNTRFTITSLDHDTDYRLEKIRHHNHYISPLTPNTNKDFQQIWNTLTDQNIGAEYTVENNGRKITLKKTFKNIAQIDFSELCDQPLGASDYIKITQYFEIILLDNIPQLTSQMRNQATRFRNLIDALYEAKTKIYFRASVPAHEIYVTGDYSFEFERTLSRIQEMQSIK